MDEINEQDSDHGAEPQYRNADSIALPSAQLTAASTTPKPIAPVWHTVLLVLIILAVSFLGVYRHPGARGARPVSRLDTYAVTVILELALVGWVAFGLRLQEDAVPISLWRECPATFVRFPRRGDRDPVLDRLADGAGDGGDVWMSIEAAITHRHLPIPTGQPWKDDVAEFDEHNAARAVVQLAPENGQRNCSWLLLCMLVGVAEELVFRGYLQQQFTAWTRGATAARSGIFSVLFGRRMATKEPSDVFARGLRRALQSACIVSTKPARRNFCAHLARCSCGFDGRVSPFASPFVIEEDKSVDCVRENCCYFFHPHVVFFLTLAYHESIHSSTAINVAELDANHRKGRIGKWQLRKQPRRHPRRRPRRKPRRRSNGSSNQKATPRGTLQASPEVFLRHKRKGA